MLSILQLEITTLESQVAALQAQLAAAESRDILLGWLRRQKIPAGAR